MLHLHKNYKWLLFLQSFLQIIIISVFLSVFLSSMLIGSAADGGDSGALAVLGGYIVGIGFLILLVLAFIAYGIASWWYRNYTYELDKDAFRKEFGILTKRRTSIPYERIQNVDIIAPLLYRIFGLAQVNVQTAGGSSYALNGSEGRLPGVSKAEAEKLQAELIRRAQASSRQGRRESMSSGV